MNWLFKWIYWVSKKKEYEECFETSTEVRCQDENKTKTNNEIVAEIKNSFFFKNERKNWLMKITNWDFQLKIKKLFSIIFRIRFRRLFVVSFRYSVFFLLSVFREIIFIFIFIHVSKEIVLIRIRFFVVFVEIKKWFLRLHFYKREKNQFILNNRQLCYASKKIVYQRLLVCCLRDFLFSLYADETDWEKWRRCRHWSSNDDASQIEFVFATRFSWSWFIVEFEQRKQQSQSRARIRFNNERLWFHDVLKDDLSRERQTKFFLN